MPLADHAGVVAVGAQQVGPGGGVDQFRLPVESGLLAVGAHAVGVRVLPGEEARPARQRSEEHTSELQSLMRISYAVFCLKKKIHTTEDLSPPDLVLYNETCDRINYHQK